MCAEPADGFFTVGHKWYFECPKDRGHATVQTVVLMVLTITAWLKLMNLAEGLGYDALDIGVKFLHIVGFIVKFPLRWHPNLDFIVLVLLVANLEVDFIGPHCIWRSFNSIILFFIQLLVPFIIIGLSSVYWLIKFRRSHGRFTLQHAAREPMLNRSLLRDGTVEADTLATYTINRSLQVFGFMYQVLAFVSFSAYSCRRHPRGDFLRFYPDVQCGSGMHQAMIAVATIYLVCFLLALPIVMLFIILRARKQNGLLDLVFTKRFGLFYEQFKVEYAFWEIIMIFRKLSMSLILALVEEPMIQGAFTILVIYICMIAQVSAQPFQEARNNILETVCLFCALAFVFCGMMFYPSLESSPECIGTQEWIVDKGCLETLKIKEYFSMGLALLTVATFLLAMAFTTYEIMERYTARKAEKSIEKCYKCFGKETREGVHDLKKNSWSLDKGCLPTKSFWHTLRQNKSHVRSDLDCMPSHSQSTKPSISKPKQPTDSGSSRAVNLNSSGLSAARPLGGTNTAVANVEVSNQASGEEEDDDDFPNYFGSSIKESEIDSECEANHHPLRLHISNMIDGYFLQRWRVWLEDVDKRDGKFKRKFGHVDPKSPLMAQELSYLKSDLDLPASVCKHLNALGASSSCSLALACRALVTAFPGIIDFLCTAQSSSRDGLFSFLQSYLTCSLHGDNSIIDPTANFAVGNFGGGLLAPQWASVMCDWLLRASEVELADFRIMMVGDEFLDRRLFAGKSSNPILRISSATMSMISIVSRTSSVEEYFDLVRRESTSGVLNASRIPSLPESETLGNRVEAES